MIVAVAKFSIFIIFHHEISTEMGRVNRSRDMALIHTDKTFMRLYTPGGNKVAPGL